MFFRFVPKNYPEKFVLVFSTITFRGRIFCRFLAYWKNCKCWKKNPRVQAVNKNDNKSSPRKCAFLLPTTFYIARSRPAITIVFIFGFSAEKFTSMKDQLNDFAGHVVGIPRNGRQCSKCGCQSYRNPFDIPRRYLLDQVFRMRSNFLQKNLTHTKLLDDGICIIFLALNSNPSPLHYCDYY